MKDLARFKPMQRHLFLYDKMLLFCKKREETTEGHEKTPSYSFKHSLKVRRRWRRAESTSLMFSSITYLLMLEGGRLQSSALWLPVHL